MCNECHGHIVLWSCCINVSAVVDPTPSVILATTTGIYTAISNNRMIKRLVVEDDSDRASGK